MKRIKMEKKRVWTILCHLVPSIQLFIQRQYSFYSWKRAPRNVKYSDLICSISFVVGCFAIPDSWIDIALCLRPQPTLLSPPNLGPFKPESLSLCSKCTPPPSRENVSNHVEARESASLISDSRVERPQSCRV